MNWLHLALGIATLTSLQAQEIPAIKRLLPPPGTHLPSVEERRSQEALMAPLWSVAKDHPSYPNAAIYLEAVRRAHAHGEFYHKDAFEHANSAIESASRRFDVLRKGETPWKQERGLIVCGFRSQLDDSLQPYGLEVPEGLDLTQPSTLYVWLHGRGDKNTDLYFIRDREKKRSPFQFEDGITLHPFGRHCIGFKAAGEVDVLEAIRDVQRRYRIDETRIVLLGFSMGGAGAWHLGAHHAGKWAAVHAGAGFAETAQYNRLKPENYPPSYEQTLWRIYDVPNYARNFFNVPLVAYSGENDKQIQAAQVMAAALEREGKALYHVIGPEMGHKYHPDALTEIKAWLKTQLVKAAEPRMSWHWQTRTLRYAGDEAWQITGLKEHYQDSRLDAVIKDAHKVRITTKNITSFRRKQLGQTLTIDGQPISAGSPNHFLRDAEGQWSRGEQSSGLHKRPGLQGPIDDAFLEPFLEVTPAKLSPWHEFESKHFHERWSALFRGQVRSKTAEALTEQDRQAYHLLYWGTPMSDPAIKRFMTSTPIQWSDQEIRVGDQHWDSQHHMLLMIYPNPEQPDRYIVLNSGPTFREAHDRTNSIQNPKLGDWAIIDTRTPPNDQAAGKVVASGFFDEQWQPKKSP